MILFGLTWFNFYGSEFSLFGAEFSLLSLVYVTGLWLMFYMLGTALEKGAQEVIMLHVC